MSHDKYFRELYKELYQKQKEEAELAKQVTEQSPISLISVSSKFFFGMLLVTLSWGLTFFHLLQFKGLAVKQDYSRQGQEKKEERKVRPFYRQIP